MSREKPSALEIQRSGIELIDGRAGKMGESFQLSTNVAVPPHTIKQGEDRRREKRSPLWNQFGSELSNVILANEFSGKG